jgi:hypothetical protein
MPYGLVFSIPSVTFNFQNPSLPNGPLHRHVGLILIFLEDPVGDCACVHGAARLEVCLFRHNVIVFMIYLTKPREAQIIERPTAGIIVMNLKDLEASGRGQIRGAVPEFS